MHSMRLQPSFVPCECGTRGPPIKFELGTISVLREENTSASDCLRIAALGWRNVLLVYLI